MNPINILIDIKIFRQLRQVRLTRRLNHAPYVPLIRFTIANILDTKLPFWEYQCWRTITE